MFRTTMLITVAVLSLTAVLMLPGTASSQAPASLLRSSDVASLLSADTMGELTRIYVPRNEVVIARSLDFARNLERSSADELDETRRLGIEAEGRVRIMSQEIATSKVRRDIAKKAKEPGIRDLEDAVKQQERELKYLKQVRDALKANSERLESDRVAANAYARALELELEVARRQARLGPEPLPEDLSQYRNMLSDMFRAQESAADRWVAAGKLRKQVAEQQIKGMKALDNVRSAR